MGFLSDRTWLERNPGEPAREVQDRRLRCSLRLLRHCCAPRIVAAVLRCEGL